MRKRGLLPNLHSRKRHDARGFSLVEVVVAVAILATFSAGALRMWNVGAKSSRQVSEYDTTMGSAEELVAKIASIPYGSIDDPVPTMDQLLELLDADDDLGSITFNQVAHACYPPACLSFELPGVSGQGSIFVDNDLNGDGSLAGLREGRGDLYRIEVFFNGKSFSKTLRSAPPDSMDGEEGAGSAFGSDPGVSPSPVRGDTRGTIWEDDRWDWVKAQDPAWDDDLGPATEDAQGDNQQGEDPVPTKRCAWHQIVHPDGSLHSGSDWCWLHDTVHLDGTVH